ncbi:hypothetical protein A3D00_01255 [Candidatus Woesebacteria bacterium RIFCSPHIGHO2_02_FULL_38_9]|uniref:DUF1573 domain-containing protein n=1 Tax=Candidatus Woesebacteria bacterium RIFCSPHIGHO2_01_FULL_39_28 TaxID=1802496 RepID=A0A1F7YI92_9BACT|nr:MAG: hypothetical protein A2627_01140 [Candidatus Woesebacteria bacterium RIFCSPHIGHO2_01_FULL_39_28]OGM31750.1 MAG: hypothetical protein A3D00_01255 [Candidatus Woesebacteria bacterium RIFCSPHIGHO2_02_FULL_38_9]OGM57692.1 MAG: hypothetical protein A3A50_01630 [Candidatus Woesebacteria bacterium RIFCSPLOWO2_01_FULL_38_20]
MSAKALIISSVVFVLIVVGLVFLFTSGQKPDARIVIYSANSADKPKIEAGQTSADLGRMKVTDIKKADFSIKNSGTKPLQITEVNTSCHCTSAQIIYKTLTTPEYGMSNPAYYVTDIAPGDSATVRVIYKPSIMPVSGPVEREAYISTNDPTNPRLIFSVRMDVQ